MIKMVNRFRDWVNASGITGIIFNGLDMSTFMSAHKSTLANIYSFSRPVVI